MPSTSETTISRPVRASAASGEARLSSFETSCVEFFADMVHVLAIPRSVGQIYGLLFASQHPLGFTEVAERLQISRGSASQGLQFLRSLGAVLEVSRAEDRRELYQPEMELRKLVAGLVREKIDPSVSAAMARLLAVRARAEECPEPEQRKFALQRVKKVEAWRRQVELALPLIKVVLGKGRP